MTRVDRIGGLTLAAIGVSTLMAARGLPAIPGQPIGPAVFPYVIGAGLCLCGLLIFLSIGTGELGEDETVPRSRLPTFLRLALPPLLLVFYVLCVETLGFLLTGAAVVLAASLFLGAGALLAVPLSLAMPVFIYSVFSTLLRVPLPDGILPLPW